MSESESAVYARLAREHAVSVQQVRCTVERVMMAVYSPAHEPTPTPKCSGVRRIGSVARAAIKNPEEAVKAFCRSQALAKLKYTTTVEWSDLAREESPGTWIIAGLRKAKGPDGKVDQQYTCRVELRGVHPRLRLMQIFKEASKTGQDIFEVH
jgi:hypothetical protein